MDSCSSQEEKMDYKKAYDELKYAQGEIIDYKAAYLELKQAYKLLYQCFEQQAQQLKRVLESIAVYEEQIKQLRQDKFGRHTEQSQQVLDEPQKKSMSLVTSASKKSKRSVRQKGRALDTSQLPRCQIHHTLPKEQQICQQCGKPMKVIGQTVTEKVEALPRQCFVKEHCRDKYACQGCGLLKQPPAVLDSPLPKSFAGSSFIANIIINKYQYHQPLYRQSQQLKSQGIDIPDNTLNHWVMESAKQLLPLFEAFWTEIQSSRYLQVDETPVKVLNQESKAYLWVYLSPQQNLILYDHQPSRGGIAVESRLKSYKGKIQSDGYVGYTKLRRSEAIEGFGCMAHARRKFVDVVKVAGGAKGVAHQVVETMEGLYRIEKEAREHKLSAEQRQALREKEAKPILEALLSLFKNTHAPPNSGLGKAISYSLKQWPYLKKYVNDGEVEIDNNWVENAIRPFALGRRNWLFIGHNESGKLAGLFYSLIESAKLNDLCPNVYMHYLLTKVTALRRRTVDAVSLLPHRIDREVIAAFEKQHQKEAQQALGSVAIDDTG